MTKQQLAAIERLLLSELPCKCGMEQTIKQASDAPDEFYCTNVECDVKFYVDEDGQAIDT